MRSGSTRYVEFIKRKRGTKEFPALKIELNAPYDEQFIEHLKGMLRHGEQRCWDEANMVWRIHPDALDQAADIAKQYFPCVYLVEGDKQTELHTGQSAEQVGLFR